MKKKIDNKQKVVVLLATEIKDNDLKAIYLINYALEISSPRMRKANLDFILKSKRWSRLLKLHYDRRRKK